MRWVKRIALGLLALIVLAVVGVLVYVHTDAGRNKIRSIGNQQLANIFTGGGSIGKVEGTPFGDLILKDVVINGPDAKPAITVKTLHVSVSIFDLVHRDVKLKEVLAEDLDVAIKRDPDGTFPISRLLKPAKKEPAKEKIKNPETSPWNIDLNDVTVLRGHVMIDTGQPDLGVVNLDDVVIEANAQLHGSGTRTAGLRLGATWRERKVPLSILGAIRDDAEQTIAPHLAVSMGGVTVAAANLALVKALPGKLPGFSGTLVIAAPKAAVAALVPRIDLPGDVALSITAKGAANSVIPIEIAGNVGEAKLKANVGADLEKMHLTGTLETSEIDAAKLTHGRVIATGAVAATFDVMPGAPGELPTVKAKLTAHGSYQQIPRAELSAVLESHGQEASTTIEIAGPAKAKLEAAITRAGQTIHLDRALLVAAVADPMRASGGKAPVHGALDLKLAASGQLSPSPDLAIKGAVNGKKLRMQDLSASTLALAIDGTHLPSQPQGSASLVMTDVVRGEMQLGKLQLGAKSRSDGRIAVHLTSTPKQDPWLIDLVALVTPPGPGDTVTVELQHHRVRAGNGTEWTGDTGRFVMDPRQLALTGFTTASRDGKIALDLTMLRASGDLTANADIHNFALAAIGQRYRGSIDATVAVARKANRFTSTASLTGKDLSPDPTKPGVDVQAKLDAKPGAIKIDATAQGAELGKATVAIQLAAPANVTDAAAWKRAGRDAVQEATITAQNVDLAQVATLTGRTIDRTVMPPPHLPILGHVYGFTRPGAATPVTVDIKPIGGKLDGTFTLTPTTAKGTFKVADLQAPQVRGLGRVDAELVIDQTSAKRIVPVLKISTGSFGTVTARAELALPDNPMDPLAWQKLGLRALHGATLRTGTVKIDPAMLERLGIHGTMNGTATFTVDIGEALDSIKIVADINDLHGSPIAMPIGVHLDATLEGRTATAQFLIKTAKSPIMQVQLTGRLPMTIQELRANPLAIKTAPVDATLELKQTSAPALLAVFGRDQITDGGITGKIDVTGTLGAPIVKAHVIAANLVSRPGSRGRRTPTVKQLVL
ncbi:MAG: AsmA family protein, partial [Kofleriaceae bacterium]